MTASKHLNMAECFKISLCQPSSGHVVHTYPPRAAATVPCVRRYEAAEGYGSTVLPYVCPLRNVLALM